MTVLLSVNEPPAYRIIPEKQNRPFLLVCDHASNRVPTALDNLGLPDEELARHIGWDIGAQRVTELLAKRLGAAAVLANYSRLVIDLNRDPSEPSAMPEISDATPIPANQSLSEFAKAERTDALFTPYHTAISEALHRLDRKFPAVALIAIHSFTPRLRQFGVSRPWHIGCLWRHDKNSAQKAISFLRARTAWDVGDNAPYSMLVDDGFTINHHAQKHNRPALLIEIRQDEIQNDQGQQSFAAILGDFLETYKPELIV